MLAVFIRGEVKIIVEGFLKSFPGSEMRVNNRVGNMGWPTLARYFGGSGHEISDPNRTRAYWPAAHLG